MKEVNLLVLLVVHNSLNLLNAPLLLFLQITRPRAAEYILYHIYLWANQHTYTEWSNRAAGSMCVDIAATPPLKAATPPLKAATPPLKAGTPPLQEPGEVLSL